MVAEISRALEAGQSSRVTLRNYRKDGTEFWNELHLSPVVNDAGELMQYIGVQNDVTEQHMAKEQADFLAHHDPLTGLANRSLLQKVLTRSAARAERHGLQRRVAQSRPQQLQGAQRHLRPRRRRRAAQDRCRATARGRAPERPGRPPGRR